MTPRPPSFTPVPVPVAVTVVAGLNTIALLGLSEGAHSAVRRAVPIPSQKTMKRLTIGLAGLHVAEAGVAWQRARSVGRGRKTAARWAAQTLVVGYPSLVTQQKTLLV